MNSITEKFKEIIASVLPFIVIVVLLSLFVIPLDRETLVKFLLGSLFIMIGMPIFLQGIDLSISPMGEMMSQALIKKGSLRLLLMGSYIFGFIVTVAEPDMHILAGQINAVTMGQASKTLLLVVVSGGVGLMVSLGILRMLKAMSLPLAFTFIYIIVFGLALFVNGDYLALAFDASGSTTGSITVPFLLALSSGITVITRTDSSEDIDSFGLLGIASAGAIIAVLLLGILSGNPQLEGSLPVAEIAAGGVVGSFLSETAKMARESILVILPVVALFFIMNMAAIKLKGRQIKKLAVGLLYTWLGLTFFLAGVNTGFMDAARQLGYQIAGLDKYWLLILVGAVFGLVTIPAEPSVHVLTRQIEEETAGSIKGNTVMLTLCIGVAAAVGLSILRIIIPGLHLWHILLPGMALALLLSYYIPSIFVGIAFDSGGVASGTMTATFILPFAQGAAERIPLANVVTDGFGVIALVAMTPLIALQILGLIYKLKIKKAERMTQLKKAEGDKA